MPDRVEVQNITCPPGTTTSAPLETVLVGVVACIVVRFIVSVPPGHAGTTGIAIGYGHNAVLPRGGGFISGDQLTLDFELSARYPAGPQYQAFTCNTDTQAHTWQVVSELIDTAAPVSMLPPQPIQPSIIYQTAEPLVIVG